MNKQSREKAEAALAAYNTKLEQVRRNPTLSDLGRRDAVRDAYDSAMTTVRQIRATDDEAREAARSSLARRLFGLPTHADPSEVVSYRDAADRVAKVRDAQELGELMQRAHDAGDKQLLKAAAGHAFSLSNAAVGGEHFAHLVDEYAKETARGADLEQYREVLSRASVQAEAEERMATTPRRPAEIDDRRALSDESPMRLVGRGHSIPGTLVPLDAA